MPKKRTRIGLSLLMLAAAAAASAQSDLTVTPEKGQSTQQLWADRYACDALAQSESGYDSSRPAGEEAGAANAAKRASYRSALITCLEGKGYSVRRSAPSAAPPAPMPPAAPSGWRYRVQVFRLMPQLRYRPLTGSVAAGFTIVPGATGRTLRNGSNAALGLTWSPTPALPLAFRIDGSYSRFGETNRSLQLAAQRTGTNVAFGEANLYGADADAQLNLNMEPTMREYLFGGVGWYREQTIFRQLAFQSGVRCFFGCFAGFVPVASTVEQSTTGWLHSWNAGLGIEFALAAPASFFIEARFQRIEASSRSSRMAFVPIRFGLRF